VRGLYFYTASQMYTQRETRRSAVQAPRGLFLPQDTACMLSHSLVHYAGVKTLETATVYPPTLLPLGDRSEVGVYVSLL